MRGLLQSVVLTVALLAVTSAQTDSYPSVKDYLNSAGCSVFLNLITALNLDTAMDDKAYTVFAPTDEAFGKFFSSINVSMNDSYSTQLLLETFPVANLIRYHFSPQPLVLAVLPHGQKIQTFLPSDTSADKLRITVDRMAAAPGVVFRGWESFATVTAADIKAGKSVVHLIDNVLLPRIPRDPGFYPPTLLDLLDYHSLRMFKDAVSLSGLWDGLQALNKSVTLMAPSNEAMLGAIQAMGKSLADMDMKLLANLVRYHVADGLGTTARMMENGTVYTWLPRRFWSFNRDSSGTIKVMAEKTSATLLIKDSFSASGCVVHVIDSVLFPLDLGNK